MVWRSPSPLRYFCHNPSQVLIFTSSEISRLQEGHRLHNSVSLGYVSGVHIGLSPKSLAPIPLWGHVEGGSAKFRSSGSLQLENMRSVSLYGDASVIMNDSPRAPSIHFKRGNTLSPASQLGVRTCTAIPTRPLLSTSPLLPSFPGYAEPGRMVLGKSRTVLLPLSHAEGW